MYQLDEVGEVEPFYKTERLLQKDNNHIYIYMHTSYVHICIYVFTCVYIYIYCGYIITRNYI